VKTIGAVVVHKEGQSWIGEDGEVIPWESKCAVVGDKGGAAVGTKGGANTRQ
jgi:hypothetical protein